MHEFVNSQDEVTLEVALPVTMKLKVPFLQAKMKMGAP